MTLDQQATKTLRRVGQATVALRCMAEQHKQALADLSEREGDIREAVRLVMAEHYETLKATTSDTDEWHSPYSEDA